MARPYATLLSVPGVVPRMLAVASSAIPLGMLSLAIVLSVQEWTGSFGTAGAVSGLFGAGNALGLALQGLAIDRYGARRTLLVSGPLCTTMLFCLTVSGQLGAPLPLTVSSAALAGATIPAVTAAVRSWLGSVLTDPGLQGAAYAMLAALFQAGVTIGPAVVTLALLLGEPSLAIGIAGGLVLVATALLATAGGRSQSNRGTGGPRTGARGALRSEGLLTLLGVAFLHGAALGATAVAISALATASSRPVLAGVAMTALAVGEVSGALVFGAVAWPGRRGRRLLVVQSIAAVAALGVFVTAGQPVLLLVALLLAGALAAPVAVLTSALLDEIVPRDGVGRAYSLVVASGLVATALGNAGAGQLVEMLGGRNVLLIPMASICAATAWTLARLRTLTR